MADSVWAVCEACGCVAGDSAAHVAWHASLTTTAPAMAAVVTVRDPETGGPLPARAPVDLTTVPDLPAEAMTDG